MKFHSPLRYPGGKAFLSKELERIINSISFQKPIYVEPYAGGAGVALALLFANKVKHVVINDKDIAIYSFWKAVTENSKKFAHTILNTPVTIKEWKKQKKIYADQRSSIFDRGFATFFLNRVNRSGVLNAGPIGGQKQDGNYKIDARYNKNDLANRVLKIGKYKKRIKIKKEDGIDLTKKYLGKKNTFVFLDPPYFEKGALLYMNHYKENDHKKLADLLNKNSKKYWILTYDDVMEIRNLYKHRKKSYLYLNYGVHDSKNIRRARELKIYSDPLPK